MTENIDLWHLGLNIVVTRAATKKKIGKYMKIGKYTKKTIYIYFSYIVSYVFHIFSYIFRISQLFLQSQPVAATGDLNLNMLYRRDASS